MLSSRWRMCAVLTLCLLAGTSFHVLAQTRIVAGWNAESISRQATEYVTLRNSQRVIVASVNRPRVSRLVDAFSRLQSTAGISAELLIVQTVTNEPNAFASVKNGRNLVGMTISMLDLLGDDIDAHAAILGHELAHINKQHGDERAARSTFLQGLGVIATLIISARTGVNVGGIADLGVDMINKIYTRDEERDADRLGFDYMISAGFDPNGGLRLHQRLLSASNTISIPFLSTHPSGDERIENMRKLIASAPHPTPAKFQTKTDIKSASTSGDKEASSDEPTAPTSARKSIDTESDASVARRLASIMEISLIRSYSLVGESLYAHGLELPRNAKATFSPTLVFLANSGWNIEDSYSGMRRALAILGQCGISANKLEVLVVEAPLRLTDFSDALAKELLATLNIPRPAVFLVNRNLHPRKFEYEVIADANSKTRPELRNTIWIVHDARDLGEGIARTLMYLLMDRFEVNEIPGSLFNSEYTNIDNSHIQAAQCEHALRNGAKRDLLKLS